MTEDDKIKAQNAETLRSDPTFQFAVLTIRKQALEGLAKVEPTDVEGIRTLQARIAAIDLLATEIRDTILRGTPQRHLSVA